jgi:hypothetical protein
LDLLQQCLQHYPLRQYQSKIQSLLAKFAASTIFNDPKGMLKGPLSNGAGKKAAAQKLELVARLHEMNARGVRALAVELYRIL